MCKYLFEMLFTIKHSYCYYCILQSICILRFYNLSLCRYNRAEIIRNLLWKIGHVLPQEIEEKLSHAEEEHFKKHSTALKSYMSKVMVDLTVVTSPFPLLESCSSTHTSAHAHAYTHKRYTEFSYTCAWS